MRPPPPLAKNRRLPRTTGPHMTAAVNTGQHSAAAVERSDGASPADVFVVFGITGDLAKVMTFHSLYRLEARGLLDCPIVGGAFDHWKLQQPVQRARDTI